MSRGGRHLPQRAPGRAAGREGRQGAAVAAEVDGGGREAGRGGRLDDPALGVLGGRQGRRGGALRGQAEGVHRYAEQGAN